MTYLCFPVGPLATNCYVVWEDPGAAVVIDPGADADYLLSELKARGLTVACVLLTHAHFDHMLAAGELLDATGAPLYVPEADVPALSDTTLNLMNLFTAGSTFTHDCDRALAEGDTVQAGGLTLTVWHTPGHTRGSSCFLTETGVVFAGDTLFAGSAGRTDFPGGDAAVLHRSLLRLMTLPDDTVVLPGHDAATTIGTERRENPYIG